MIKEEIKRKLKETDTKLVFVEIPLLYEANFLDICDYVILAYIPYELELKRLMKRDNIDSLYAEKKISSQISIEKKKELADYIIDTGGTFKETKNKIISLLEELNKLEE